jgi:hypothetical protein
MSTAVVSTSAAPGRPFLFDAEPEADGFCHPERSEKCVKRISHGVEEPALSLPKRSLPSSDPRLASVTSASRLEIRPLPEMVTSGIPALDALTGGLPRGCLTEICGPASSGRTSVMLAALAAATRRGEYCAVIDASDALDPHSLAATGIDLDHLLWVRCDENSPRENSPRSHASTSLRAGFETEKNKLLEEKNPRCPILAAHFAARVGIASPESNFDHNKRTGPNKNDLRRSEHRLEQVLCATDLLLESGGFGLIILDLADVPHYAARRIPLTTWFRFRRAVEHKPTILLAIEQQPIAGSCSSLLLQLKVLSSQLSVLGSSQFSEDPAMEDLRPSHAHLFTELKIDAELIRSRLDRKPACSVAFETKTAWAG